MSEPTEVPVRPRSSGILLGVSLGLLLGLGLATLGAAWFGIPFGPEQATPSTATDASLPGGASGPSRYVCPMHPSFTSDQPGTCPICQMDLVEFAPESEAHPPADPHAGHESPTHATDPHAGHESPKHATDPHAGHRAETHATDPHAGHQAQVHAPEPLAEAALRGPSPSPAAVAQYQCPMHPQVVRDAPGSCPICGMDLVLIERPAAGAEQSSASPVEGFAPVQVSPERRERLGLKWAPVVAGELSSLRRISGHLAIDETRVQKVNVKVQGTVEELYADHLWKPVKKGQVLFTLYSPELVAVQNEYLLALKTRQALASASSLGSTGDDIVSATREHLSHWDMPQDIVRELERTGRPVREIPVVAPQSGVISAKSIVQGATINPGETPLEITDLSVLWMLADLYETEQVQVRVGDPVSMTFQALPGQTFPGKVSFIQPILRAQTRSLTVRIDVANPQGLLRPELLGEVELRSSPRRALLVPRDAILDSGTQQIVFVATDEGLLPRQISTGQRQAEQVEVLSGLQEGEQVVTRASFLIDSESRLRSALTGFGGH